MELGFLFRQRFEQQRRPVRIENATHAGLEKRFGRFFRRCLTGLDPIHGLVDKIDRNHSMTAHGMNFNDLGLGQFIRIAPASQATG